MPDAFGETVDFAQLVKVYGDSPEGHKRYRPAQCLGTKRVDIIGDPDQEFVSGHHVQRGLAGAKAVPLSGFAAFSRRRNES